VSSTATPPTHDSPLVVIFNKRALAARALKRSGIQGALRERKIPHDVVDTATPEQGRATAEEAARAGCIVVAAGGDGTARAVASGVLAAGRDDAVMGVVPLGTGNDLARALGRVGDGFEQALDALAEGRTISIDVGQVNGGEYFVNVIGVGFDAEVARRRSERKIKLPSYFPYAVRAIFGYEPRPYSIAWPGGTRQGVALMIAAMNGTCEGGGIRMAPRASLTDGLLDIYWFAPISLLQFARYIWAVRWGTHERLPMVEHWQAGRLTVESESPLQYHLDGEYREIPGGGSLEIVVHPGRLRMIV
jgi:YegS/Rv2252/BmrU family lipid kinase